MSDGADSLLSWFASLGIPMAEKTQRLGAFSYYRFNSYFQGPDGRPCTSYGRSQDRKTAAIKCVGESIERKYMIEFFQKNNVATLPPKELRTSNGWAVHQNRQQAEENSHKEALERHLLLKSFLKFGWSGFHLIEQIENEEMTIYLLASRFSSLGYISGMAIAMSPNYRGASFGYCLGKKNELHLHTFWEPALFESIDKILTLKGESVDLSLDPDSWITKGIKEYLENPFDIGPILKVTDSSYIEESTHIGNQQSFDLAKEWNLNFPLYASYSWGGDLIPLFHQPSLSDDGKKYLEKIIAKNQISSAIPERHPIL